MPAPVRTRCWRPDGPLDLRGTLAPLWRRAGDPAFCVTPDGAVWRVVCTPDGVATLRLSLHAGEVEARAWGPGAARVLAGVPDLLGARDDPRGLRPAGPPLRDLARRHAGLRIPRTGAVWEALVPAVLEQRVTGSQARRSWRELLRRYGEPAPGPAPAGMRACPGPQMLGALPSWEWHRLGVDPRRAATVRRAAAVAARLEQTVDLPGPEADRRLRSVPGVGAWTSAEVRQRAHGDADAVSVGDYHLPRLVGWALAGDPYADDARMLALLAPYAGHRHRVVRLLERSGVREPRFGPRLAPVDIRPI